MCRHSLIHRANTIDRWKLEFEPFSSGYRIPELFLRIGKSKSFFYSFILSCPKLFELSVSYIVLLCFFRREADMIPIHQAEGL